MTVKCGEDLTATLKQYAEEIDLNLCIELGAEDKVIDSIPNLLRLEIKTSLTYVLGQEKFFRKEGRRIKISNCGHLKEIVFNGPECGEFDVCFPVSLSLNHLEHLYFLDGGSQSLIIKNILGCKNLNFLRGSKIISISNLNAEKLLVLYALNETSNFSNRYNPGKTLINKITPPKGLVYSKGSFIDRDNNPVQMETKFVSDWAEILTNMPLEIKKLLKNDEQIASKIPEFKGNFLLQSFQNALGYKETENND